MPEDRVLPADRPPRAPSRLHGWWLDRSVWVKGLTVVAVPFLALVLVTTASLVLGSHERQQRASALRDHNLSASAAQILSDAVNAETGVRGFLDVHDSLFLAPYVLSVGRLDADLQALGRAARVTGATSRQGAVASTTTAVFAQLADLRDDILGSSPAPALTTRLAAEKQTMDLLRDQIAALADGPSASLAARSVSITRQETALGRINLASFVVAIVAGLMGLGLFTSGISRRVVEAAANADRLGAGEPLEPVTASSDELGQLARSLSRAELLLASRTEEMMSARDTALRATDTKNSFLSHTSHELRTPLNSILGFTQLLEMSDLSPEDRDSAARILGAGRHLLALINELIDIARIESGDLNLSLESVSVVPLVEQAGRLLAPLAALRSITIVTSTCSPDLAVYADQQRLSQVLVNLISNAVKYNRPGGEITITCGESGPDDVTIAVSDGGPGLTAADLDRIFVPFERLGAAQTGVEGTGIGLPLARALTEAMAGTLSAASAPGNGSVFTVTIPRAPEAEPVARREPAAVPRRWQRALEATPIRILYIEDNLANVEVVSRYLRPRSHVDLACVFSGREGIDAAHSERPDLILLDLHLSDLYGGEVLAELKSDAATAGIPVVVLSADASPGVIHRLLDHGALTYLTKPIDLTELGGLIDLTEATVWQRKAHVETGTT